jgi:hypothetical protein
VTFRDRIRSEDIVVHLGEKNIIEKFKVYQSQWEHPVLVSTTPACTFPYLAPFYKLIG